MFDVVLAVKYRFDGLEGVLYRDVGDKAEPPVVDAQQGDVVLSQQTANAEHGAIAAHDNHQVGLAADFSGRGSGIFGHAGILGRFLFNQNLSASRAQHLCQCTQRGIKTRVVISADQRYG